MTVVIDIRESKKFITREDIFFFVDYLVDWKYEFCLKFHSDEKDGQPIFEIKVR